MLWGLTLLFLAVGLGLLVFAFRFFSAAKAAQGWPKVQGKVVTSAVRSSRDAGGSTSSQYPEIAYSYEVDGASYTSKRYRLGDGPNASAHDSAKEPESIVAMFPTGKAVDVYYDPQEPSSAVLNPQGSFGVYVPAILGVFFGGIGLFLLYVVLRKPPE